MMYEVRLSFSKIHMCDEHRASGASVPKLVLLQILPDRGSDGEQTPNPGACSMRRKIRIAYKLGSSVPVFGCSDHALAWLGDSYVRTSELPGFRSRCSARESEAMRQL